MNTDIENYVKQFATYLLSRDNSQNTVVRYSSAIADLLNETNKTPDTLNFQDIENYIIKARQKFNYNNKKTRFSGIKKYLRYLKVKHKNTIYDEYITQRETTDEDVFRITEKVRTKPKNTLTVEEASKLIEQAKNNPRNYAILKLMYHSWQRVGSIIALNNEDIDFIGEINPKDNIRYHRISIKNAKGNQSYDIYIVESVIDAIKKYLNVREKPKEGFILDNYRNKQYHKDALFLNGTGKRLKARAINNFMKQYAIQSGLCKPKIHTHLWRSSGITIADSNNVSLGQIMARSGHTNIQSVTPYLNAKKDETNTNINKALSNNNYPKEPIDLSINNNQLLERLEKLENENKKLKEKLENRFTGYQ